MPLQNSYSGTAMNYMLDALCRTNKTHSKTSERLGFTVRFKIILLSTCQLRVSPLNSNSQFNFTLFRNDTINTYKITVSYTKGFRKLQALDVTGYSLVCNNTDSEFASIQL